MYLSGILIFVLLRSPCKICQPYDKPFREISNQIREKDKNDVNRGHYILPATSKDGTSTPLEPISNKILVPGVTVEPCIRVEWYIEVLHSHSLASLSEYVSSS